jgi:hypothetical protein
LLVTVTLSVTKCFSWNCFRFQLVKMAEKTVRSREEIIDSITKTKNQITDLNAKIKDLQSKHRFAIFFFFIKIKALGKMTICRN